MAELTVGMTYGSALYQAATEVGKRDVIREEAKEVLAVFKQDKELNQFMDTPVISVGEKKEVLKNIFENRISEELLNFLYVMVDKGRARHFERAIKVYEDLFNREEGFSYGKICSVTPLTEEQIAKFEEEAGKLLKEKVKLENEIDADLIGGVKILIDGKVIDASLRKRLDDLSNTIV